MGLLENTKTNAELKRLEDALNENEKLMQEAALKYEDLVAAKEDLTAAKKGLTAAIRARKKSPSKDGVARRVQSV